MLQSHLKLVRLPERTHQDILARKLVVVIFLRPARASGTFVGFLRAVLDDLLQQLVHQLRRVRQKRDRPDVDELNAFVKRMLPKLHLIRIRKKHIRPKHTPLILAVP
ncbi:hypothetical protein D3C74_330650 [compost metagenome]